MARRRKPVEIEASRIILRDTTGQVRIVLDAGGENGFACIDLYAKDGCNLVMIGSQPSGAVVLAFNEADPSGWLTLSAKGISLTDTDGKHAVTIGRIEDESNSIVVYHKGERVWQTPPKAKRKAAKRSKSNNRSRPG